MKKKKTLIRYLGLMIALFVGCLPVMAGGNSDYYSKVTATATGEGKVYVSYKNESDNPSYAKTSEAESGADSQSSAPKHTYHFYATGGEGTPVWKDADGNKLGEGDHISYGFTAATDVANATYNVTMEYVGETEFTVDGIKYEVSGATTVTIAQQSTSLSGAITIPATVTSPTTGKQYTPTIMAGGAFMNCKGITSVKIEAPIKGLGTTNVTVSIKGSNQTMTGSGTFLGCEALTTADLSACEFTTTAGGGMFAGCSKLTSVTMPNELTEIGKGDFVNCSALKTLDLSNTALETIGDYACCGESSSKQAPLQYVYVPESLNKIGDTAFGYCDIRIISDLFNSKTTSTYPSAELLAKFPWLTSETKIKTFSHLSGVTSLSQYAFTGNYSFQSIVLPNDSLTTIPKNCFSTCFQLNVAIFGKNLTTINSDSFNGVGWHSVNYVGSGVTIKDNNTLSYKAFVLPPKLSSASLKDCSNSITKMYVPSTMNNPTFTCGSDYNFNKMTDVYAYSTSFTGTSIAANNATLHMPVGASEPSRRSSYFKGGFSADIVTSKTINTTADQWTTVCLPERAEQPAGVTFYTLSRKVMAGDEVQALVLAPVAADAALEAGVPYIYKGGNVTFNYVYGAKPADEALAKNGLHGTFSQTTGYTFVDGVLTEDAACAASCAYIVLNEVPTGAAATGNEETIVILEEKEEFILPELTEEDQELLESGDLKIVPLEMFAEADFHEDPETGEKTVALSSTMLYANSGSNAPKRVMAKEYSFGQTDLPAQLEGHYVVPEKVLYNNEYYTVNSVKTGTFAYQHKLTSIILPATITEIETTTLQVPELSNMEVAGASALFYNCFSLKSVDFGEGSPLTNLGAGCFFGCYNLTTINNLPAGLIKIADGMFSGCHSLADLDLSGYTNLKEIGFYAFSLAGIAPGTELEEGDLDKYFGGHAEQLRTLFPDEEWNRFAGLGMNKVILPTSVTDIKYGAFHEAGNLELVSTSAKGTVSDLSNIQKLGQYVFAYTALKSVKLDNSAIKVIPNSTFAHCKSLTSVTLSNDLLEVDQRAFYNCTSLASVNSDEAGTFNLPTSLKHVAGEAFYFAPVVKLNLPASLQRISAKGFYTYPTPSLTLAVSEAETAPVLGKEGSGKANDIVDKSAASLEYMSSADYCETLDLETIANPDAFQPMAAGNKISLVYPESSFDSYLAAGWNTTFDIPGLIFTAFAENNGQATCALRSLQNTALEGVVTVPSTYRHQGVDYTVTTIQPGAFSECKKITEVILPATITTIETKDKNVPELNNMLVKGASGIFYDCFSLQSVTFGENSPITDLGAGCFFGCYNLTTINNLPTGLTKIADGMFAGCHSLPQLDLSAMTNLTEIGFYAFTRSGIKEGTELNEGDLDHYFGGHATELRELFPSEDWNRFAGIGMKKIILPASVTGIKYGAFFEAENLELVSTTDGTVSDLSNITALGQYAFGYTALTNVKLDNAAIKVIPNSAFTHCENLTSVTLSNELLEVGQRAFYNCHELVSLNSDETGTYNMPKSLEHIGGEAFYFSPVEKLVLPASLKRISARAFYAYPTTNLSLVIANGETAPILGKVNSTEGNIDCIDKDAAEQDYMSGAGNRQELPVDEVQIANPDAFQANADDETAPVLFVGFSKKSEYDKTPWDNSFYVVEKHERNVTPGNFGTLCIPYSAQIPTGCEFYCASSINYDTESKRVSLELAEVTGLLEAGMPYLFQSSDATSSITMNPADELSFARTPKNENGLHGALADRIEFEDNTEGIYMLKNNKLYKAKTGSICSAYRAYVNIKDIEDNSAQNGSSKRVNIDIELDPNDATAIFGISFGDGKNAVIYDLNGRMQSTATKGIYIINGKKVIK